MDIVLDVDTLARGFLWACLEVALEVRDEFTVSPFSMRNCVATTLRKYWNMYCDLVVCQTHTSA